MFPVEATVGVSLFIMCDGKGIGEEEMKILIVSNTAWNNNNSFGNSFSDIFGGMENIEIANIYCRKGFPCNHMKGKFFRIDEELLVKSIWNRKLMTGYEIENYIDKKDMPLDTKYYDTLRKLRFRIFYWIRDIIWQLGKWKTNELNKFIEDFQPDIMFQPVYYSIYINKIALYIKEKCNIPMVCYISDDNYSLHYFSSSPMYWIERLYKRRYVKQVIDVCDFLYVISDIQKKEYDQIFKKPSAILTKCKDFKGEAPIKRKYNFPLKLVYMGNINSARGKTLGVLAKCIEKINACEDKVIFEIYTLSPLQKKMIKSMRTKGVYLRKAVNSTEIEKIQSEADVLVHVESMDRKGALEARQSFSTKIVEYLSRARCILAIGHTDCASIDYFLKYNAALVATSKEQIEQRLKEVLNDASILDKMAQAAWNIGVQKHQREVMQEHLSNILKNALIRIGS